MEKRASPGHLPQHLSQKGTPTSSPHPELAEVFRVCSALWAWSRKALILHTAPSLYCRGNNMQNFAFSVMSKPCQLFYSSHSGFWMVWCKAAPQFPLKHDHLFTCSTHYVLHSRKATTRLTAHRLSESGQKREQDRVKSFSHKSFWHIFLSLSVHVINLLSFQEQLRFLKTAVICGHWWWSRLFAKLLP